MQDGVWILRKYQSEGLVSADPQTSRWARGSGCTGWFPRGFDVVVKAQEVALGLQRPLDNATSAAFVAFLQQHPRLRALCRLNFSRPGYTEGP